jgi:hypothetical protein
MASAQETIDRVNRNARFLEARAAVGYERDRRDLQRWQREEAVAANRQREISRINAETCDRVRHAYADAFFEHGAEPPLPLVGEGYNHYRNRLLQAHIDRLPDEHKFAHVRADAFDNPARNEVEKIVLVDSIREARAPSGSNRPDDPRDPRAMRTKVDPATGARTVEFHARTSFIKALGRPALLVRRLMNPNTGVVLHGPDLPRAVPGRAA